jgi:CRISPR-associated protein Cas2
MRTLVIYDIECDRTRLRIADACKDYGLARVQKSAFRGDLNTNRREMLFQRLSRLLGGEPGSIHIYTMCDRDAREMMTVEQAGQAAKAAKGSDNGN